MMCSNRDYTLTATLLPVRTCSCLICNYAHRHTCIHFQEEPDLRILKFFPAYFKTRDIVVGIASRSWVDGPEIESWGGRDFPHRSKSALGPTQPPIQWELGRFPGGKAAGEWL
jgi:hypothetical protein